MMELNRGDIVLVNLNPQKQDEMGKIRPAVVLSSIRENNKLSTILIAPISTQIIQDCEPYRLFLSRRENLFKDGDICITQIRAISKIRVIDKLSKLTVEEYNKLKDCICQNI